VLTFLVLIGIPILEIVVAAWVASWAGLGWMLLALVGLSVLGILILPGIGVGSFAKVRDEIANGRDPSMEIVNRMLLLLAAVLLILPGFITGAAGLLLLLPPLRHLVAQRTTRRFHTRVQVIHTTSSGSTVQGPVIDATATDAPPPSRPQLEP
jgi:UPF0716 protein FxsA